MQPPGRAGSGAKLQGKSNPDYLDYYLAKRHGANRRHLSSDIRPSSTSLAAAREQAFPFTEPLDSNTPQLQTDAARPRCGVCQNNARFTFLGFFFLSPVISFSTFRLSCQPGNSAVAASWAAARGLHLQPL